MARAPRIEIEGMREARRRLRALSEDAATELRQTHRDAAEVVARQAKIEVPVRSGRLLASIRASSTTTQGRVKAGGYGVKYAGPIHFGVPRLTGRPANIRPQPFIYAAADKRIREVVDVYEERIAALIRRRELD